MVGETVPYVGLVVVTAALSGLLARAAWQRRPSPGAVPFAVLMIAVTIWATAYAFELAGPDLAGKVLAAKVVYLGVVTVPVAWLAFSLEYTGREYWLTSRRLMILAAIPIVTLVLVWTNEFHGLIWSAVRLDTTRPFALLSVERGWWFWIFAIYTYLLLSFSTILIVADLIRFGFIYRGQALALLVGTFAPWISNALYLARLTPVPNLDLTPFAFTVSGLAIVWGLYRYKLLDIVPIANDLVVRDLPEGVVVLNARDQVIAANPAATSVVGESGRVIGRPVDLIFAGQPGLQAAIQKDEGRHELVLRSGGSERFFDVQVSPLHDPRGRLAGRIILLRDLTSRREAEAEHLQLVREQAVRAEAESSLRTRSEVVSSVSHDLKNPLAAIRGTSQLLKRRIVVSGTVDPVKMTEGLDRIEAMVGKMSTLLDDLVEVTRLQLGQELDLDRRPTDLVALARRIVADQQPAAGCVTLEVETGLPDLTGEWDPVRIERAVTNLVANAIKYSPGGGEVRVIVSRESVPGGDWAVLVVSDQGVGIPAADLPRVSEWFFRAEN
ncbi:MAG TPA: histidine kinase N-terminal 7TM domain-containing protein, partial [Dehalococcoidia bacterium]|nr:histidine kinase N-terminal 7TM domain-containing protein [Dehalococcoidia bacterium]